MKKSLLYVLSVILFANVSFSQTNPISPKEALIQAQAELDDTISQLELAQSQRQYGWIALGLSAVSAGVGAYKYVGGAIGSMWRSKLADDALKSGAVLVIGGAVGAAASGGYLVFKSSEISKIKTQLKLDRENVINLQKNL